MSLMDPKWKYHSAADTDVARTFARVRRQMKEAEVIKQEPKVRPIRQQKKGAA